MPVFASSAYIRPFTPYRSLPAVPMKTSPFHAMGAAGTLSERAGSAMCVLHTFVPVAASYARTLPSPVPRNRRPSRYAAPRFTRRASEGPSSRVRHFCWQVSASIAMISLSVVKYIVRPMTMGPFWKLASTLRS